MQSADYVPGVSGWKIHDHVRLELNEGKRRVHAEVKMITNAGPGQTNDQAAQELSDFLQSYTAAEAPAVTALTSRIDRETSARVDADTALAAQIGSVQCFANAPAELHVKPQETVEPLRMGKVVFHGETARAIRDAQAALKAANVGQLEVVKRANEAGKPFVVIDDQVFISEAEIKSTTFTINPVLGGNGEYHFAGFGVGIGQATGGTAKARVDAGLVLGELTKKITESALGADLYSRITLLEERQSKQGDENQAIHDRLDAQGSRGEALTSMIQAEVAARVKSDSSFANKLDTLQGSICAMQGNTTV